MTYHKKKKTGMIHQSVYQIISYMTGIENRYDVSLKKENRYDTSVCISNHIIHDTSYLFSMPVMYDMI